MRSRVVVESEASGLDLEGLKTPDSSSLSYTPTPFRPWVLTWALVCVRVISASGNSSA